jgi:glycosyltransferase involved in cell wall biosynthesis
MTDRLLQAFLDCTPESEGLPAGFHRALLQSWLVSRAQGTGYAPAEADSFLRDIILSRATRKDAALFLSIPLLQHLNAPAGLKSALPLTRFMAVIFESLDAAKAQFDLATPEGCLRFYHAYVQTVAGTYRLPSALIPTGLAQLLNKAGLNVTPTPPPLCTLVTEDDFKMQGEPKLADAAVTLVGPADLENGLGQGLRYMADGLLASGLKMQILNRYASSRSRAADTRYQQFETTAPYTAINIIHFNSDMLAENMLVSGISNFVNRYNIGYFVWETSQLSKAHRLGVELVSEIWVPTEFMRDLYSKVTDKKITVIGTVVNPPEAVRNRAAYGLPEDKFLFVFTYDSASRQTRKNPLGAVTAFKKAFPGEPGVGLVLKTQNTEALSDPLEIELFQQLKTECAGDPRIILIEQTMTAEGVAGLVASCDAYVSLHRCEGYGYGMAEAMHLGLPVIATHWSGNTDFVSEENGYPVPFRLVPVPKGHYHYSDEDGQLWAEPDLDAAASILRAVFEKPQEARARAKAGQAAMKSKAYPGAVGGRMRDRLRAIVGLPPFNASELR